jgi:hypothetical protein
MAKANTMHHLRRNLPSFGAGRWGDGTIMGGEYCFFGVQLDLQDLFSMLFFSTCGTRKAGGCLPAIQSADGGLPLACTADRTPDLFGIVPLYNTGPVWVCAAPCMPHADGPL